MLAKTHAMLDTKILERFQSKKKKTEKVTFDISVRHPSKCKHLLKMAKGDISKS